MHAPVEKELEEMLELASRIIEADRKPTEAERERFLALRGRLTDAPSDWKLRLVDQLDRFAAMLEGMGI